MRLALGCQSWGTCYRCCPLFISTTTATRSGAEVVVVDVDVMEALALGVHALAGEGFLLLTAALPGLLFLVQSAIA
jgi:hypothetical protein